MQPVLAEFALRYPGINKPAVVSQWSMNYMSIVVPATLACLLTRQQAIDFWTDDSVLRMDAGQPLALNFTSGLPSLTEPQCGLYLSRWLHEHLAPVFATLAAAGGLAPKILWGNFVAIWDGAFDRFDPDLSRPGFAEVHRWLEQVSVNDGRLKLRGLQRQVPSPAPDICPRLPLRRHCCLHYQLHPLVEGEPLVLCESCPKLHRLPLAEQVSYLHSLYD